MDLLSTAREAMGYACRGLLNAHTMHSISAHYLEVKHCSPTVYSATVNGGEHAPNVPSHQHTAKWNGLATTDRELSHLLVYGCRGQRAESTYDYRTDTAFPETYSANDQ